MTRTIRFRAILLLAGLVGLTALLAAVRPMPAPPASAAMPMSVSDR